MTFQARGGFVGLVTATAETQAPAGALRVADNVVMRRRGALEPRQGFVPRTLWTGSESLAFLAAHRHGADTLYETSQGVHNVNGILLQYRLATGAWVTPQRRRADIRDSVMARGNLILPFSAGAMVTEAPASAELRLAGLPVQYVGIQTSTIVAGGGVLPAGSQFAYRLVATKTDSNGVLLRSRPTGAFLIKNTTGSAVTPQFTVLLAASSMFESIEIYRSRAFPNTVQVDDELQLIKTISGAPVSTTVNDTTPDALRGTTIYTAPSRGGIENSNDRPPGAACVALFKQSVFYGNTVGPQRIVFSHPWSETLDGTAGTGIRQATVTITSGSNQLTITANGGGLQRGMVITASEFPVGTYVTNVSGATITMSQNATGSVTGGVVRFHDAIELNGAWLRLGPGGVLPTSFMLASATSTSLGAYELTPAVAGYQATVVVESVLRNYPSFSIRATHGDEFSPPLPRFGESALTGSTAKQDIYPNGLMWSAPDEPEHVPPRYFAQIGDKSKAILALCPTRDALYVLKEDGIWAVTGVNGNFTIAPIDLTTFCILPSSVRGLNNRVYFLSNKGVCAIEDGAVSIVSAPLTDQMTRIVDHVRARLEATGLYQYSGMTGTLSAVDDRTSEYLLALPTQATPPVSFGGDALVYNAESGGFTTYSFTRGEAPLGLTPNGYSITGRGALLVLHQGGVREQTTTMVDAARGFRLTSDGTVALTGSLGSTPDAQGRWTFSFNPATELKVGDVLVGASTRARVVSVLSNLSVLLDGPIEAYATAYRSVRCLVEPQGYASNELVGKVWTHAVWALSRLVGVVSMTARFSSAVHTLLPAAQTTLEPVPLPELDRVIELHAGTLVRVNVPIAHRRAWLLRVGLEWTLPFGDAVLEIVSADRRDDSAQKTQVHARGGS